MAGLNQMVAGPTATSSQAINALLEAQVLLQQLNNECNQETAQTWAKASLGSANALYDSTTEEGLGTQSQGIGSLTGSTTGLLLQGYGYSTGGINKQIDAKNEELTNLDNNEKLLGSGDVAISSGKNLPSAGNNPTDQISKDTLERVQNGNTLKKALNDQEKAALQNLKPEEAKKAQKTIDTTRKEVRKEIDKLESERQNRSGKFNTLAQSVAGIATGSGSMAAASHQMNKAANDKKQAILRYVDSALQAMMQQFDKTIDTAKQGISAAIQLDQGLTQANSRA